MASIVQCKCGKRYQIKPHMIGKQLTCPNCQAKIVIPHTAGESPQHLEAENPAQEQIVDLAPARPQQNPLSSGMPQGGQNPRHPQQSATTQQQQQTFAQHSAYGQPMMHGKAPLHRAQPQTSGGGNPLKILLYVALIGGPTFLILIGGIVAAVLLISPGNRQVEGGVSANTLFQRSEIAVPGRAGDSDSGENLGSREF